ncbi:MAG: RecX family transcriptional regulator [Bacteroides sp.]|jgi:regulatory protein|nr:RecX family transcriptional regulator [Bacteroides sp.]
MKEITETEAFSKVASYCSVAEHCSSEVIEKMRRWGLAYDSIDRVVKRLQEESYIDEERFCRAFINDKYRFAKWGKVKILQALRMKKIPDGLSMRFISEIDENEYLSILQRLLEAKKKSLRAQSEYELNGKLIRFALSRGFEMKDICRYVSLSDEKGSEL